jgi:hypothetical protein
MDGLEGLDSFYGFFVTKIFYARKHGKTVQTVQTIQVGGTMSVLAKPRGKQRQSYGSREKVSYEGPC